MNRMVAKKYVYISQLNGYPFSLPNCSYTGLKIEENCNLCKFCSILRYHLNFDLE